MHYIDFKYDGKCLSDFGFIICDFNHSNNADEIDIGSKITFNKVSQNGGKRFVLTGVQYDSCIETSFDICKNPDDYSGNDMIIGHSEFSELMRWLNRRGFSEVTFYGSEDERNINYNASFNVSKIKINDRLFGLRLTMVTDSPFAHGDEIVNKYRMTSGESKRILAISDDDGEILPVVEITCKQNGNLSFVNVSKNETTYIKNVVYGEKIVMDSFNQTIISDKPDHKIFNDFNYVFFYFGGGLTTDQTIFSVSIDCDVIIKYRPIIKDAL